ncbi:MAG: hypothetical protein MZU95_16420 [Desulfomicrobium escambiense]|nr:hypothetical protein [Desulfomicrobium escambiense]
MLNSADTAYVTEAVTALRKGVGVLADFAWRYLKSCSPWSQALERVSRRITVAQEVHRRRSQTVCTGLGTACCAISNGRRIQSRFPPAGAGFSTQTLIRYPDRTKFDIDAVCQVEHLKSRCQ